MASPLKWININLCAFKKGDTFCFENWEKMNSIDALSLVSLSPSHRLDAAGTWSSISIRYYLIFKDYSKSSIWHSIPTHACNALKDEYLIHSHVSHCLRMFIWVTWYISLYTGLLTDDWWDLMRTVDRQFSDWNLTSQVSTGHRQNHLMQISSKLFVP